MPTKAKYPVLGTVHIPVISNRKRPVFNGYLLNHIVLVNCPCILSDSTPPAFTCIVNPQLDNFRCSTKHTARSVTIQTILDVRLYLSDYVPLMRVCPQAELLILNL